MCGIVAEHGGSDPDELERMLERLAHRGPDDRGSIQVNGSWLGHRRLSIVDVEGGGQPLRTPDADAYLVGNGEVYNHEHVRARLEGRDTVTTDDVRAMARYVFPHRLIAEDPDLTPEIALEIALDNPIMSVADEGAATRPFHRP